MSGARPGPRVRLALCLDRSGSMGGAKLETAKAILLTYVGRHAPADHCSITRFDDTARMNVPMTAGIPAGVARACSCLAAQRHAAGDDPVLQVRHAALCVEAHAFRSDVGEHGREQPQFM